MNLDRILSEGKSLILSIFPTSGSLKEEECIPRTVANDTCSSSGWSKSPNCLIQTRALVAHCHEVEVSLANIL